MKKLLYAILFSVFSILLIQPVSATHIMGGEITYTHISGDSFEIHLNLYRDCTGASLGTSEPLTISSPGCLNTTVTAVLLPGSGQDITPMCGSVLSPCVDPNSQVPVGVEYHSYSTIAVIPCDTFRISWESCCRNSDITSGPNDKSFAIYVDHHSAGAAVIGPNSSPIFNAPAAIYGYAGLPATFDFSATDPDGDSLVYEIGQPEGPMDSVLYFIPGLYPLASPVHLDSVTGILTAHPQIMQISVIRIDVHEYRETTNGWQHIGSTFRDIQVIITIYNNHPPHISGIEGTSIDAWYAAAGDSISFTIATTDSTPYDTTHLTALALPPGSQFLPWQTTPNDTATFTWQTDSTHLRSRPYVLVMKARDTRCPLNGVTFKAIKIFVTNPDTSEIWPGDANNDLVANHYDILPIGVGHGTSGPQRPNASTNWVGQSGPSWPNAFTGGLNYKFADCDGDGTIDTADVSVVNQNFGLTHNRYNPYARQPANADLRVAITEDSLRPGDVVNAQVLFGDSSNLFTAYGVAFSLIIDPAVIDASSMDLTFQSNWLVPQGIDFTHQDGNGNLHAANVGIDRTNKTGGGIIANLTFQIRSDAQVLPGTLLPLAFADVRAIDVGQSAITIVSGVDEVPLADVIGGIDDPSIEYSVVPNPAKDVVEVRSSVPFDGIELMNALGQRMWVPVSLIGNRATLNTTSLDAGVYHLTVIVDGQQQTTSLVIQR